MFNTNNIVLILAFAGVLLVYGEERPFLKHASAATKKKFEKLAHDCYMSRDGISKAQAALVAKDDGEGVKSGYEAHIAQYNARLHKVHAEVDRKFERMHATPAQEGLYIKLRGIVLNRSIVRDKLHNEFEDAMDDAKEKTPTLDEKPLNNILRELIDAVNEDVEKCVYARKRKHPKRTN
uniref:DUF148 domain-containing protein n=1 Tax=Rhabditophanes sp. KR3021 TaxID=114890 RepID=A0AC35TGM4_9BILA